MIPARRESRPPCRLSILNSIADGAERGTSAALLNYRYIARGSAGEFRSMLHFRDRLPEMADLKSQISNLRSQAESCSRQLRAWADSLQNSDLPAQRHLTVHTRQTYQQQRRAEAFWKQNEERLRRARPQDYPHRPAEP